MMPNWSRRKSLLSLSRIKTKETGKKRRSIFCTDEVTFLCQSFGIVLLLVRVCGREEKFVDVKEDDVS